MSNSGRSLRTVLKKKNKMSGPFRNSVINQATQTSATHKKRRQSNEDYIKDELLECSNEKTDRYEYLDLNIHTNNRYNNTRNII